MWCVGLCFFCFMNCVFSFSLGFDYSIYMELEECFNVFGVG